jgi:hypothetical protein
MSLRCFRALAILAIAGVTLASFPIAAQAATTSKSNDTQIAKQGALVASDFPSGWTQKKAASSSDAATEKAASKIPDCKQYIVFQKTVAKVPRAKSPDFDLNNSSISNTVSVFKNAKSATAVMNVFGSAKTEPCINKLFGKLVTTKGVTVTGQIKSVDLKVGDQSVGYAGTIAATPNGGQAQTFGVSVFAIRTGRGVGAYSYFSDSDQTSVLTSAVNSSMTRLQTALA